MLSVLGKLQSYPASDLYRFFVDGRYHQTEFGWFGYAEREPGSVVGAYNALSYAITHNLEDPNISSTLIKEIHRHATSPIELKGFKADPFTAGEFRDRGVAFLLIPDEERQGYCNQEGLQALRTFVKKRHSQGCGMFIVTRTSADVMSDWRAGKYTTQKELDDAFDELYQHAVSAKDQSSTLTYKQLREKKWYFRPPLGAKKDLESYINTVCAHYNTSIKNACDDEEKLRVIVAHIQAIERIHPFEDGNGRTSYILLQRLLIQNGFLPTIMANPNHLDGFGIQTVIKEIKEGMQHTQALIDNPTTKIFGYLTKEVSIKDTGINEEYDFFLPPEHARLPKIKHIIQEAYKAEKALYLAISDVFGRLVFQELMQDDFYDKLQKKRLLARIENFPISFLELRSEQEIKEREDEIKEQIQKVISSSLLTQDIRDVVEAKYREINSAAMKQRSASSVIDCYLKRINSLVVRKNDFFDPLPCLRALGKEKELENALELVPSMNVTIIAAMYQSPEFATASKTGPSSKS